MYTPSYDPLKRFLYPGQKIWVDTYNNGAIEGYVVDIDHWGWPDFPGGLVYYWITPGAGHAEALNEEFYTTKYLAIKSRYNYRYKVLKAGHAKFGYLAPKKLVKDQRNAKKFSTDGVHRYRNLPKISQKFTKAIKRYKPQNLLP